jgi:hypothetical protein
MHEREGEAEGRPVDRTRASGQGRRDEAGEDQEGLRVGQLATKPVDVGTRTRMAGGKSVCLLDDMAVVSLEEEPDAQVDQRGGADEPQDLEGGPVGHQ